MFMTLNFKVPLLTLGLGLDDPSIGPRITGVDFIYIFKSSSNLFMKLPAPEFGASV